MNRPSPIDRALNAFADLVLLAVVMLALIHLATAVRIPGTEGPDPAAASARESQHTAASR